MAPNRPRDTERPQCVRDKYRIVWETNCHLPHGDGEATGAPA
ncbi:hypothetical protein [Streptomyces sp. YGL11-2]